MSKKLICLVCFVLVLGAASNSWADLLVYWPLDEGTGTTAYDSTGNGYDGTFNGAPQWVEGLYEGALEFDGVDDYVVHNLPSARNYDNFTVALWVRAGSLGQGQYASPFSSYNAASSGFQIDTDTTNPGNYRTNKSGTAGPDFGPVTLEWVHLALVAEGTDLQYYYNGTWANTTQMYTTNDLLFNSFKLGASRNNNSYFDGAVDDLRVYDHALTEAQVRGIMTPLPPGLASGPNPADGAIDVPQDVVLSWMPGEFADKHDVYFGTAISDVNDASRTNPLNVLVSQGRNASTYEPAGPLDFGQTYYWRIDEVNAPPDNIIFKGKVWQFTAEPFVYPIAGENITATASSSNKTDEVPENTINGSGLDDNDLHSTENTDMWLSSVIDPNAAWIQYEFDRIYKLHQMLVWNHNSSVELVIGFGIKEATIEYSADGTNWITLGTHEFARGSGTAGYESNTTVDLSGVVAKYVKITANSNWGGFVPQFGLSEVCFIYLPVLAREPDPASGFEDYNNFSPDRVFQRWIDGIGYSADEFLPVDNPGNGSGAALGHDIWSYDSPHYDGDIMETTIVHGGGQSAPLYYDNINPPFMSEIERTFDIAQDWTKHGIKALTLYFYGDPNNVAQQMYVKLNGVKVLYDGEAANITRMPWQAWNIELADLIGVNLSNVTELTIGLERIGFVGGAGVVYFDDISLYPYSRQLITPAEPDTAGLVGHWQFEGNFDDSSGNGRHGTAMGSPAFVPGKVGQAIELLGLNDYVEITGYKGILGPNAITVTAWIKTTNTETGTASNSIVGWGPNVDCQRFGFRVNNGRLRTEHQAGNVQGDSNVADGEWHHAAVTVQANSTISYPEVVLYLNGIDDTRPSTDPNAFALAAGEDVSIGRRPSNDDRFFTGQIDDVRIYDRVLTQEEIAWMAGRTQPFDKPF